MDANVENNWNELQRRLREISELEGELVTVESKIRANLSASYFARQSLQSEKNQLESEIRGLNTPMAVTIQSLPKKKNGALPVIFFANMPNELSILCRFSFEAQLMTVTVKYNSSWLKVNQNERPCPDYNGVPVEKCLSIATSVPSGYQQIWESYYNPSRKYMKEVKLFSDKPIPTAQKVSIEKSRDKADLVCYPSRGKFMLGWWVGTPTNPFALSPVKLFDWSRCCKFTESNSPAVYAPIRTGTFDMSRGNFELCNSLLQELFGSRRDRLLRASLRCFEEVQAAKFVNVLGSIANLLDNQFSVVLLKMSLFQYGTMGKLAGDTVKLWTSHIALLRFELYRCVESWQGKQSFHPQLLVIIQIVNYLSLQKLLDVRLARRIAHITSSWADIAEAESRFPKLSFAASVSFRAKSCRFRLMTLCTLPSYLFSLTIADVEMLISAIVCARLHMSVLDYCEDKEMATNTKNMFVEVQSMIASASTAISKLYEDDRVSFSCVLSQCALLVITNAKDMLTKLLWRKADDGALCYEADTNDRISGRVYLFSVNLVNGVVLKDGLPVGRPSVEVERSMTYLKLFSDRVFEVIDLPSNAKRIQYPYYGFYFEFISRYDFSGSLQLTVIREVDPDCAQSSDRGLRLIFLENSALMAIKLPKRLMELHYHWYSEDTNAIYFTEKRIESTRVSFLFCCSSNKCFVVPEEKASSRSFRALHSAAMDGKLSALIPSEFYPSLGFHKSLLGVESGEFVHVASSSDGSVSYVLPRLSLEFQQEFNGTIKSINFAGFIIDPNQQLQGMVGFKQYILLSNGPIVRVLIPYGTICYDEDGYVKIEQPSESSASIRYCWYDLHPSIPEAMIATTIESRLYLALLVSANASYRIDEQFGCRGYEFACQLIRCCSVSRLLTNQENAMLQQIMRDYSTRCPTLYLLCYLLLQMTCQLDFLPYDNQNNCASSAILDSTYLMGMCKIYNNHDQNVRTVLTSREIDGLGMSYLVRSTSRKSMSIHPQGTAFVMQSTKPDFEPAYAISDLKGLTDIVNLSETEAKSYLESILQSTKKESFSVVLSESFFSPSVYSSASQSVAVQYMDQLRQSWLHLKSLTNLSIPDALATIKQIISVWILPKLQKQRDLLAQGIISAVGDFGAEGSQSHRERLLVCHGDTAAVFGVLDILRVVLDESILLSFNKHLSQESISVIKHACLKWMACNVLCDKLTRMTDSSTTSSLFMQELKSNSYWSKENDPVE